MIEHSYARRADRREVDIACEVIAGDWDEPLRHRATDLSPYGIWLRTALPRRVGERVCVCFRPNATSGEINVFAEVARVERRDRDGRSGMGLAFLDLTRDERCALGRRLRSLPAHRRQRPVSRHVSDANKEHTLLAQWRGQGAEFLPPSLESGGRNSGANCGDSVLGPARKQPRSRRNFR